MLRYERGETLGEGQFGVVFKSKDKETGRVVAIKKIRLGLAREGVNMTALREVKLLKELKNPHVVALIDVFAHKNSLALVFEYMESDLEMVIKNRATVLSPADIKAYMQMLLQSLECCHSTWILHRDIKPNNFLITSTGEVKIGDFGLARLYGSPDRRFTNQVFARWYRPPELLFGSNLYGPAVDIWAVGCCFAELLLRRPWLPGNSDIEQLSLIFQSLGTPTRDSWPGVKLLPNYIEFQETPAPPLKAAFPRASDDALDLLASLTTFDPRQRPSANVALQHSYFKNAPKPTEPSRLPKPPIRAHNPLMLQPEGGSAIQMARTGSGLRFSRQQSLSIADGGGEIADNGSQGIKRKLEMSLHDL